MYEARFTTKQVYDNYAKSISKPKNANQQAARTMSSVGIGGLGGKTTTASAKKIQDSFKEKRERRRKNQGSTYDEVPQSLVQKPEPKPVKETGYEKVLRVFNEVMEGFGVFDEPTQPTYDTVDTMNVYKDKRYFGPQVYSPDIDFKDPSLKDVTPKIFKGSEFDPMYKNLNTDRLPTLPENKTNIFGANKDNPSLNMFGLKRGFTEPPAPLMSPPSVEAPANMDPVTRILSQAMLPEPAEPTADYTTKAGDTLFSIQKTLKENGINTTVEEIAEINDIGLDGIFGIKPGTELKLPMPSTDAAPKEVKAALEKLTPITMTEDKSLSEQLKEYTEYYKKLAADALGIDIETDENKIKTAVSLGSKQYKVKKGDTLSKIARANGITLSEILKANPNIDPDKLSIGDTIKLPKAGAAKETGVSEVVTNTITPVQEGKLNIGTGNRNDYKDQLVYGATPLLSMDYNGGGGRGVEVIVPDWVYEAGPGNIYFDAAQKYIDSVIKFANDKGYGGYKPRKYSYNDKGIKSTTMNNNRGHPNVIHIEPFFHEDKKMVDIVNKHKEEFFDLYYNAFKDLPTTIIPPHGTTSDGVVDPGALNDTLESELQLGRDAAEYLKNKYGKK